MTKDTFDRISFTAAAFHLQRLLVSPVTLPSIERGLSVDNVGDDGQTLQWLVVHAQLGRLVDYLLKVRSSSTTTGGEETHVR
jgi:hypothetical protein